MRFNVHAFLHFADSVKNWGPLWAHNTYTFETENHDLMELKNDSYRVASKVVRRYFFYKTFRTAFMTSPLSVSVRRFCVDIVGKTIISFAPEGKPTLVGRGTLCALKQQEKECFDYSERECRQYKQIWIGEFRYTIDSYVRNKKRRDSVFVLKDGD